MFSIGEPLDDTMGHPGLPGLWIWMFCKKEVFGVSVNGTFSEYSPHGLAVLAMMVHGWKQLVSLSCLLASVI